ncbi:MAG: ATP-binding protein [Desulfobacterota bacterium]|nr:ATP-binding protein [Thermodesulfobacteriota bacterium]
MVVNISLLMLVAIFLIGFTTLRANEKHILQAKIRNCEIMVQDFQTILDLLLERREFEAFPSPAKKAIEDFIQVYGKGRPLLSVTLVDRDKRLIASHSVLKGGRSPEHPLLQSAMNTGTLLSKVEKEGGLFTRDYKKVVIASPLWFQGRVFGGVLMEVSTEDVMRQLIEYQRMFLLLIVLDSFVLVIFGSFLLSRVLVNPLKDLVRLTQRISQGDLDQTIEANSNNEIGQLVQSFNRMTEQLREKQKKIEIHLQSLELANAKLKQTQEELLRTEKLASIGRFAAGVAHEVGNPLGSILGYTNILAREDATKEEIRDYTKRIEKEIERINRIVKELLNFARPSKLEVQEVDVNRVIEETLSLLSYQKSFRNIETQLSLQPDLPRISGNESQLSQVLINIIMNAVDAMPEGGVLKIGTEELIVGKEMEGPVHLPYPPRRKDDPLEADFSHLRSPDPFSLFFTKFSPGDQLVKITITDNGIGIKAEDKGRIFDPFFTTKDPDKGTGLGLSISLRIVESFGGEIKVKSEAAKGTTFEIYFPVLKRG